MDDPLLQKIQNCRHQWTRLFDSCGRELPFADRRRLEEYSGDFSALYPRRPIAENPGGMELTSSYWLFVTARFLNPALVVESGVWRGHTTWILRRACPQAAIHSFDISLKNRAFVDPSVSYHEQDWTKSKVRLDDPNRGLAFFDDHVNQARRTREAWERGFKWLIFDDNVPLDQLHKVGRPALPSIGMLTGEPFEEGREIRWQIAGRSFSYRYAKRDEFSARELIDFSLVFPTYTGVTLVKLK